MYCSKIIVIIMRYAANLFVELLQKRPGLEMAAFVIVGWVGVKLAILTLAHPDVAIISETFVHSTDRKSTRLNSSHVAISYAVFCLKKKKHTYHFYQHT